MNASALIRAAAEAPCQPWPRHVLNGEQWRALASALGDEPSLALLALWADPASVHALFHDEAGADFLLASTAVEAGSYPTLSPARPAAATFERMVRDLWGHSAADGRDARPWLDHGRWDVSAPLAARPTARAGSPEPPEFLPVEGEDLHQIPLGPVHGGVAEPAHFRFTAAGETVLRLEVRLGYAHKGTLALLRGKSPRAAARFAARLSGDSTVAHSIAFARAAEAASATEAPPRAEALRAVMAELERIANHLAALAAIADAAAFAPLQTRCLWLREGLLRAAAAAFGHRLMMDCVVPGGLGVDIVPGGAEAILKPLAVLEAELPTLLGACDDQFSLADRLVGTGRVAAGLAASFAAGGCVGRAAGRAFDVRRNPGYAPYHRLDFDVPVLQEGDVDARTRIRLAEIRESIGLLRALLASLPDGFTILPLPIASGEGIGWAEGFRGDIWHWLRLEGGMIATAFLRDPGWLQWPVLESAILGNAVADFPLCEASFNCSCSGVDL
jgi:Ni,Fe-hydrogenase III large subunit